MVLFCSFSGSLTEPGHVAAEYRGSVGYPAVDTFSSIFVRKKGLYIGIINARSGRSIYHFLSIYQSIICGGFQHMKDVSCLQVQTGSIAAAVIREAFNTVLCEALKRALTRFWTPKRNPANLENEPF